ncbi:hypothetical protein [Paenibacillus naphthalenovorans]
MRMKLIRQAAYWLQVEEVAHEPAVQRYVRRRYDLIMAVLKPMAVAG